MRHVRVTANKILGSEISFVQTDLSIMPLTTISANPQASAYSLVLNGDSRIIFKATAMHKICRKIYNRELENMFGDFVSPIILDRLIGIGYVNTMEQIEYQKI